jgi:hypothetical protein
MRSIVKELIWVALIVAIAWLVKSGAIFSGKPDMHTTLTQWVRQSFADNEAEIVRIGEPVPQYSGKVWRPVVVRARNEGRSSRVMACVVELDEAQEKVTYAWTNDQWLEIFGNDEMHRPMVRALSAIQLSGKSL